MSSTKAVHFFERMIWVADNAHDIVVAHLVEAADDAGYAASAFLADWRVCASIADLSLHYPDKDMPPPDQMATLLADARTRVVSRGDVNQADLECWSVLPGAFVSGGFLRTDRIPVDVLVDVVDSFEALVAGTFADDPSGAAWLIGVEGGRCAIPMRDGEP